MTPKPRIRIVKDAEVPETVELLAKSIVQVSDAAKKILDGGLTERALVVLMQDMIGPSNISKGQIKLVLENLPRLRSWYVKGAA